MKFIVILTHGRSGSTVLKNVVSLLPNSCIRGENGGLVLPLGMAAYQALTWRTRRYADTVHGPWTGYGKINFPQIRESLRRMFLQEILDAPPDADFVGFKEIRFFKMSGEDLFHWAEGMRFLFPEILFIINSRKPEDTARSRWFQKNPDARAQLEQCREKFINLHRQLEAGGFQSLLLDHDQWSKDYNLLKQIYLLADAWPDESEFLKTCEMRLKH